MSQHLRLVRKDHVPYLQAAISTSLSQSSPYDAKLVGEDGFVYINRLVFALLHPELACCPVLASEVELSNKVVHVHLRVDLYQCIC